MTACAISLTGVSSTVVPVPLAASEFNAEMMMSYGGWTRCSVGNARNHPDGST